jgi:CRISPR/Cas system-associated exonuclease Cas4 (RecB family)
MKNGLFEEKLRPGWQFGVPYEDWECKYCNYKTICPSKLK